MDKHLRKLFGKFGLERETLRVDRNCRLAQTPHPFDGDYLTRDFCENQLEIITPVCGSIEEMFDSLAELDRFARERLSENGEKMLLYSNPPYIESEDEIPIAKFDGNLASKRNYRLNLERRYGKRLMLYSGIHFNFSLPEEYIHSLHSGSDIPYKDFKSGLYFRLFRQISRYSWLIVLLTAASPVYDLSFDGNGKSGAVLSKYSSMRNSERGYWNQFMPELDYTSPERYAESVNRYIEKGVLYSASELYLPVRLKPRGENSLNGLLENGVDHMELRMFDLNLLEPLGISVKDVSFAYALALYLLSLDDFEFTADLQVQSIKNHQSAALYDISDVKIDGVDIHTAANEVFDRMSSYFADNAEVIDIIEYERRKLNGERLCEIIARKNTMYSNIT